MTTWEITNGDAVPWMWIVWGAEVDGDYDIAASTGGLYYEAEALTPLGGAATAVGATGASGSGSNVVRHSSLPAFWTGVLSTQASGGGAHLAHVGTFRVYSRVLVPATNGGTVSVALEWAQGDFTRSTRNDVVTLDPALAGSWRLVDLGLVTIAAPDKGTAQRWEGRVRATTTVPGDTLDVDFVALVPGARSGLASALIRPAAPMTFVARDDFAQSAGSLAGKTMTAGGTWSGSGSATDFTVSGSGTITRATSSETFTGGRFAQAGTSSVAGVDTGVDFAVSGIATQPYSGLYVRWVDASNYLLAAVNQASASVTVSVFKRVAGVTTTLAQLGLPWNVAFGGFNSMRLLVDTTGLWALWLVGRGTAMIDPLLSGYDAVLATGGALATGKAGIYDANTSATAVTRTYDAYFLTSGPQVNAVAYPGRRLRISSTGVTREDPTGSYWARAGNYQGEYLRLSPAHPSRFILLASQYDPATMPHVPGTASATTLTYAPRWLTAPA